VKALQDHIEPHGCRGSHGVKARAGLRSRLQQRHVALQTLQDAARVEQKVLNGIVEYLKSGGDCAQVAETLDSYLTGSLPDVMQNMWVVCVELEALERRLSRLGTCPQLTRAAPCRPFPPLHVQPLVRVKV
jgi:hypothetical protein